MATRAQRRVSIPNRPIPIAAPEPSGLPARHFSVRTVAELYGFDRKTIERMFKEEPGVLEVAVNTSSTKHRKSMRIPEPVMLRVMAGYTRR